MPELFLVSRPDAIGFVFRDRAALVRFANQLLSSPEDRKIFTVGLKAVELARELEPDKPTLIWNSEETGWVEAP